MKPASRTRSLEEVHGSVSVKQTNYFKRLFAFVGPAYLVSVGYMDPGNWATDIEGGARFGYSLIWVVLMSNWMAILLQTLSARLGIVTGRDLAQGCREEYSPMVNRVLWVFCEIAIAACDLAEVLGTIIGLKLLFGLPLLWGCLVTAFDTFLLLLIQRAGIRKMEGFILALVGTIGLCFILELFLAKPDWEGVASGFIPTLNSSSLYIAIGILGATVMPHNLYLHSALVQTRRVSRLGQEKSIACQFNFIDSFVALNAAFFVNAAILVMAAASFYSRGIVVTEIEQAHNLLHGLLGSQLAPIAFGVALLCAGQSSTLTGTLAGQIVMEGFVNIKLSPWLRRLITRMMALLPAVLVISIMGEQGSYPLLILSQVVLSLQLPFAIIPLIHFTNDSAKMGQFANKTWVKALAWLVAAIIIVLNIKLVYDMVGEWISIGGWVGTMTWLIAVPVCILALGLLVWILVWPWFRGTHAWRTEKETIATHVLGELREHPILHVGVSLERSENDAEILSQALTLAKNRQSRLTLLHIVDTPHAQVFGNRTDDFHSEGDQEYLEELGRELEEQGLAVGVRLGFGYPVEEIVRIVREEKIDLLVLGSHGHRYIGDLLWGQTVDPVRHALNIPVMVVRSGKAAVPVTT